MKEKGSKFYYCTDKKCISIFESSASHPEHLNQLEKIPSSLSDEFLFIEKLGAGATGVVFKIFDVSEEKTKALKIIKVENPEEMKKELNILYELHHKGIVTYFRSGILKNNKVYIIMEECEADLGSYLEKNKANLSYNDKINLFLKICEGINYIHHHKNVIYFSIRFFI